jgi:hypothetical protein
MYVFETKNHVTQEIDSITGKSVIEICGLILNYSNGKEEVGDNYTVLFIDNKGNNVLQILEESIRYAIFGSTNNEVSPKDSILKNEAEKFMTIIHSGIDIIEFSNPVRYGEAYWDAEYVESDSDNESSE